MLIGVAGMVGTGKTTLSRALATRFGLQIALESVDADNPWLESFYGGPEEMRAYALHLQLHFLATRFASMRRMRGTGRKLGARSHLVRRRRDLRARTVRARADDAGRVAVVSAFVRGAAALAGRASSASA